MKNVSKIPILILLGISLIALTSIPNSFATTSTDLYSCDKNASEIHKIDENTGTIISSQTISISGTTNLTRCLDLSSDPTTGTMYMIIRDNGDRGLATIDPTTGSGTKLGNMSHITSSNEDLISTIWFDNTGQLYAKDSNDGLNPSVIFAVDKIDGSDQGDVCDFADGEGYWFADLNLDDGKMYRLSEDYTLIELDLTQSNCQSGTDYFISEFTWNKIQDLAFDTNTNRFFLQEEDGDPQTISLFDQSDTVDTVGSGLNDGQQKGLAFALIAGPPNDPPVIALNGATSIALLLNDFYLEENATCFDTEDGSLPVTIGGDVVNTSVAGVYSVTYDCQDSLLKSATTVIRTVTVSNPPGVEFWHVDILCDINSLIGFIGLIPFLEICPIDGPSILDSDEDGLLDSEEDTNGNGIFEPELGETDPNNPDTDNDGLTDGDEVNVHGTDPLSANTVVNVALILVEFNDVIHNPLHDETYFEEITNELKSYFKEASYDNLVLIIDIFDNNGNWYQLSQTLAFYAAPGGGDTDGNRLQFINEAISISDGDVEFTNYDYVNTNGIGTVVFIPASFLGSVNGLGDDFGPPRFLSASTDDIGFFSTSDGTNIDVSIVPEWRFRDDAQPDNRGLAHELGHALGKILGTTTLDHTFDANGLWALMGATATSDPPTDPLAHLISYNKEQLNWLNYAEITQGNHIVNSLPTMEFGDQIMTVDETIPEQVENFFILEARTSSPLYSNFDNDVPNDALLIYYVNPLLGIVDFATEPFDISDPSNLPNPYCNMASDLSFRVTDVIEGVENFEVGVEIGSLADANCPNSNMNTVITTTEANILSETSSLIQGEIDNDDTIPDIDLHAFTDDGLHVGMNYLTGEYENQIPNALASGDLKNLREWISIPSEINVIFVVDSTDNLNFFLDNPDALLLTDGIEDFSLIGIFSDENSERHISTELFQQIDSGEQLSYVSTVVENPDGSFTVSFNESLQDQKNLVINSLNDLSQNVDSKIADKIIKVIKHIDKSTNDKFWEDNGESLVDKKSKKVFDEEKKAVKGLMKIIKKGDSGIDTEISDVIDLLVEIDRKLAQNAINEAKAFAGDKKADKEIEKAEKEMDKAQKELDEDKFDKAIERYKKTWEHAQKALNKKK